MDRPFRIVTHRNWLAEAFKDHGAVQDFGFDIDPDTAMETLWWAPGAWVASAWQAGVRLPLTSCGHRWMLELPYRYRRRDVVVVRLDRVNNKFTALPNEMVHVKLPEAKLEAFPATMFHRKHLADTMGQFFIPKGSMVQISKPLKFTAECRFWVAHRRITAHSWYLVDGKTWDADGFQKGPAEVLARMRALVEDMLGSPFVPGPPGFTVDVGLTDKGHVAVVEANAAWSSSPYDGNPAGVVEAIVASHDFDGKYEKWRWRANPVYGQVQPLKTAKAVMA